MSEAAILAFTALKAFAQETIPESYEYVGHARSPIIFEVSRKSDVERFTPIDEKLCVVLPLVCCACRQQRIPKSSSHERDTFQQRGL